jgi:hypothetical protein
MELILDTISIPELKKMAEKMHGNFVKAVVDVKKEIMMVDADLHADEEYILLEEGSKQEDLWGINLFPDKFGTDEFVEFNSKINVRPADNNRSRGVDDPKIREKIKSIVQKLVVP